MGKPVAKDRAKLAVQGRQRRGQRRTSPFSLADRGIVADADHLGGAPRGGAFAGLPHHIGEGELHVLLGRLQPKKLSVEEHEGVEKDKGRVDPQLLTLPQVFFLHSGEDCICNDQGERPVRSQHPPRPDHICSHMPC